MSTVSATPAWPRRPPVWSTLAVVVSLVMTAFYCRGEAALMAGNQGKLLSAYVKSALWSYVPQMPSLKKRTAPPTHTFLLPDGSTLKIRPAALYQNLRTVVYDGKSIPSVFKAALMCSGLTLFILLYIGVLLDRDYEEKSRNGRRLRGPRTITRWRFNIETRGFRYEIIWKDELG
jgi:hypothetical protein